MLSKAKEMLKAIILFFVLFILSQLPTTVLIFMVNINSRKNLMFNLLEIAFFIVIFILVLSIFLAIAKKYHVIGGEKFLSPNDFTLIALAFVGCIAVNIIGSAIINATGGLTTENQRGLNDLFAHIPMLIGILAVAVGAPIMEEIVFRGVIIKKIFAHLPKLGCLVSILVFGLLHTPTDLGSAVVYFGMGTILSVLYYQKKNIYINISVHVLVNFIGIIAMYQ